MDRERDKIYALDSLASTLAKIACGHNTSTDVHYRKKALRDAGAEFDIHSQCWELGYRRISHAGAMLGPLSMLAEFIRQARTEESSK